MNYDKKYKEINPNKLIRDSSKIRIITGTTVVTTSCILYSFAMKKLKNHPTQFCKNWAKGSLIFSFSYYTLNEFFFGISKYYQIYSNYWLNSSLSAYILSRVFYRHLIKNSLMRWHSAILFSHKCFASLCVFNILFELSFQTLRFLYLYDEEDVIDILDKKIKEQSNFDFNDVQEIFMGPIHIFNSENKINKIRKYIAENKIKLKNNKDSITFDLYNYYKYEYKISKE